MGSQDDDYIIDALIRAEDERIRRFPLFHATYEERQRQYGRAPALEHPKTLPTPPPVMVLSGNRHEQLLPSVEEQLRHEYETHARPTNLNEEWRRQRSAPPPPYYSGPLLTLKTKGPFTRYEVIAHRPPLPPRFDSKKTREECRSTHYPRPVLPRTSAGQRDPKPGESLRRWKMSMGLCD
ncbi:hypothetical protein ERJ75_001729800 [Trypanosoma vivax]|uniref:Uncharacterized protein n=1 Tax=Trypanosoma vivax (strain Y486) TaxID=1055687 RepID=G0U393_TRYVY|nr:hypothetical protein TRVL_04490 [Trypanosoma vivax]KAH8604186.1 hypothetical protein ERJ75_001729800 [Trypanosoma vivax]CCC50749.1 conserved hypothetical protein [Trypanosoma vivax Y486]